jgi:hypothetical protein
LNSVNRDVAAKFVIIASVASLIFWLSFLYFVSAGIIKDPATDRYAGKIFPPILLAAVLVLGSIKFNVQTQTVLLGALLIVMISTFTSLRFLYLSSFLVLLALAFFMLRRFMSPFVQVLILILVGYIIFNVINSREQFFEVVSINLMNLTRQTVSWGLNPDIAHQLFTKTSQTFAGGYTTGTGRGDDGYLLFFQNLFNFERFYFPHGLGQRSFIGHRDIWGLNSIDSSIIFLNFHYSIWISILVLLTLGFIVYKSFQKAYPLWSGNT